MKPSLVNVAMLEQGRGAISFAPGPDAIGSALPGAAVVGSFAFVGDQPDWRSFRANPTFLARFSLFMRGELAVRPAILEEGRFGPGEFAYAIDLRTASPREDVPFSDIIGWYQTTAQGYVIPASFRYNEDHVLVLPSGRFSSILEDPKVRTAVFARLAN